LKYLRALLAAAVLACSSAAFAGTGTITIDDDFGGSVYTYDMWYKRVKESGVPVRIEGVCISACTLVLSLPPEQVCVASSASFGFHLASNANGPDPEFTQALIRRYYPAPIRAWLAARRLEEKVIFLSGQAVVAMGVFKSCQ
jgi:hypothetical protein